jgi:hypothetical protein
MLEVYGKPHDWTQEQGEIVATSAARQLATGARQSAQPDMWRWLKVFSKSKDVDKGAVIGTIHKPGEMATAVAESNAWRFSRIRYARNRVCCHRLWPHLMLTACERGARAQFRRQSP